MYTIIPVTAPICRLVLYTGLLKGEGVAFESNFLAGIACHYSPGKRGKRQRDEKSKTAD